MRAAELVGAAVVVGALVVAGIGGARVKGARLADRTAAKSTVYLVPFLGSYPMSCTWGGSNRNRCIVSGKPYHPNPALDIQLKGGVEVRAAGKGVVRRAFTDIDKSYGRYVIIFHADSNRSSMYAHLSKVSVKEGPVIAGQVIGLSGNTGAVSGGGGGYHLHYAEAKGDVSKPIWSSGEDPGDMTGSCVYPTCWSGISSWQDVNIDPDKATNPYKLARGRKASVPGDWEGYIVQWDADTKAQRTAWLVKGYKRYWIETIAVYNCLKQMGTPGPQPLPAATLDELTDQKNVRATCGSANPSNDPPVVVAVDGASGSVGSYPILRIAYRDSQCDVVRGLWEGDDRFPRISDDFAASGTCSNGTGTTTFRRTCFWAGRWIEHITLFDARGNRSQRFDFSYSCT